MKNYLLRFTACLVASSLIAGDPALASEIAHTGRSAVACSMPAFPLFQAQALEMRLPISDHTPRFRLAAQVARALSGAVLITTIIAGSLAGPDALAAKKKKDQAPMPTPPALKAPSVPETASVDLQNRLLITDQRFQNVWRIESDEYQLSRANTVENLLKLVINGNPQVAKQFYLHRAAWQSLVSMLTNQGKYRTLQSDKLHGLGPGFPQADVGQTLAYPGISVSSPKHQVQIRELDPAVNKNPGFLHWRSLATVAGRALKVALDGVQIYSPNQVQQSVLEEHEQAFNVRKAFADLEDTVAAQHEIAYKSFLDYVTHAQPLGEERDAAWLAQVAENRQSELDPLMEGQSLQKPAALKTTRLEKTAQVDTTYNGLDNYRTQMLGAMAEGDGDFSNPGARTVIPEGPAWSVDRALLERSGQIAGLLAEENKIPANDENLEALVRRLPTVIVQDAAALPAADDVAAALNAFTENPAAPDTFLDKENALYGQTQKREVSAAELDALFSPVSVDAPLGTTPQQRRLMLQKDLLAIVQEESLKLKEKTTWTVGAHVDLGSQPFLASILNFDIKTPERSTILSLEELITAVQQQEKAIDKQIEAEHVKQRTAFLLARNQRQRALAELVATRNEIAEKTREWLAQTRITSTRIAKDPVTPYLELEALQKKYARHLTEAWAGRQLMQLYTVEGRQRVQDETLAHYLTVLQTIDPSYKAAPEQLNPPVPGPAPAAQSKKTSHWRGIWKMLVGILPGVFAAVLFGHPASAQAQTYIPQVAQAAAQAAVHAATSGTAQQVAMDVVLDTWKQGSSDNTLSGIALDILRKLDPHHVGKFSQTQINGMVQKIVDLNGTIDPAKIQGTLHIGTYDPQVAQNLQGIHHAQVSVIAPAAPAAAPVTAPKITAPDLGTHQQSHGFWSAVTNRFHHINEALHGYWAWTMASPAHMLIAGVIAAVIILGALIFIRRNTLKTNGKIKAFNGTGVKPTMDQGFSFYTARLKLPVLLAGLTVLVRYGAVAFGAVRQALALPSLLHSVDVHPIVTRLDTPWAFVMSIGMVLLWAFARRPSSRRGTAMKWLAPVGMAGLTAWLIPSTGWMSVLWAGAAFAVFAIATRMNSDSPLNVMYRLARTRWISALLVPLVALGLWLGISRTHLAERTAHKVSERSALIKNADSLSTDFAVGPQTIVLPVYAPAGVASGIVSGVNLKKAFVGKGDLLIAVDPIADALLAQLRNANAMWQGLFNETLISPDRIATAADSHPDAMIHMTPVYDKSADKDVNDLLRQINRAIPDLQIMIDKAKAHADDQGHYTLPAEAAILQMHIEALGHAISARLLERSFTGTVPATQPFHIRPGSGHIVKGMPIDDKVLLFYQEIEGSHFIQLKLTPRDERALIHQWHKDPAGGTLHLTDRSGAIVKIPFSHIQEDLATDDPAYPRETRDVSLNGEQTRNQAVGLLKTITVNFVTDQAGIDPRKQYHFAGVFDREGTRVLEESADDITIGTLSLADVATAHPPRPAIRASLVEQTSALRDLRGKFGRLRDKLTDFQRTHAYAASLPEVVSSVEKELTDIDSKLADLDAQIKNIDAAGAIPGRDQPRDPLRYAHRVTDPLKTGTSVDDEVVTGGRVQVEFDVKDENLKEGDAVHVVIPNTAETIPFTVTAAFPLGMDIDVKRIQAQATLTPEQAARLFPPGIAAVSGRIEVKLNVPSSTGTTLKDLWNGFLGKTGIGPSAGAPGKSQLKGHELLSSLAWLIAVAAASFVAFPLASNHVHEWVLGYALSVAIHEGGHWLRARSLNISARLRFQDGNLEWVGTGTRQPIMNGLVRAAGPLASTLTFGLAAGALLLQAFLGAFWINPFLLVGLALVSGIYRGADRIPTNIVGNLQDFRTRQAQPSAPAMNVAEPSAPRPRVPYLEANQLRKLKTDVADTVLEYERYWDRSRGDNTKYLTWWQVLKDVYILRKDKIELKPYKVFLKEFERDNLTNSQAKTLDNFYQLKDRGTKAGNKVTAMLWAAILVIAAVSLFLLFAGPDQIRGVIEVFRSIPAVLIATTALASFFGLAIVIFFGGAWFISAAETWGKMAATGPFNANSMKLKISSIIFSPARRFEENTGKDPMKELAKIYNARVLRPQDPEHQQFIDHLYAFAQQIADRSYTWLQSHPQEAIAFENAFRIQVRRSQLSHAPIYPQYPVVLASDEQHLQRLRDQGIITQGITPLEQYQYLQIARIDESEALMRSYPMLTLMALLRSGNTELIANLAEENESADSDRGDFERGLVEQILTELKERANSMDSDVYDDLRAEDRLTGTFFLTLHYIFEGLRPGDNTADYQAQRERILAYLQKGVAPPEAATWNRFLDNLDRLMAEDGKTPEQIASDQNIVRGIVYALTQRRLKESEVESAKLLSDLRKRHSHSSQAVLYDGYLRNAEGQPSTNVLQLKMAYQKYFDLLRELTLRFPHVRFLGKSDIYTLSENTVNFRQTLRELELFIHLTGGTAYMLNVAKMHNHFSDLLDDAIPERFTWRERGRVKIRQLNSFWIRWKLVRDRSAIILSSAIPLEWRSVRQMAGTRVYETSPLLKPAQLADLILTTHGPEVNALFRTQEARLRYQIDELTTETTRLRSGLQNDQAAYETYAIQATMTPQERAQTASGASGLERLKLPEAAPDRRWSLLVALQTNAVEIRIYIRGQFLKWRQDQLIKRETRLKELENELQEVIRIDNDLHNVPYFLQGIGVRLGHFRDGEPLVDEKPLVPGDDVLDGEYQLDRPFSLRRPDEPAAPHGVRSQA